MVLVACGAAAHQIEGTALADWMAHRFALLSDSQQLRTQAVARDPRFEYLFDEAGSAPLLPSLFGTGFAAIVPQPPKAPYDLLYVDSELLWQLQQNGILGLIVYAAMLCTLVFQLNPFRRRNRLSPQIGLRSAWPALCTGILFTYGHYFLLHVQSSQAPLAYWYWALLGVAVGLSCRREHLQKVITTHFGPDMIQNGRPTECDCLNRRQAGDAPRTSSAAKDAPRSTT
jgi:O-antigen ligase